MSIKEHGIFETPFPELAEDVTGSDDCEAESLFARLDRLLSFIGNPAGDASDGCMDTETTTLFSIEAVEASEEPCGQVASTGRPGFVADYIQQRVVEAEPHQGDPLRVEEQLLQGEGSAIAWRCVCMTAFEFAEPPCTGPYAQWCGRGSQ